MNNFINIFLKILISYVQNNVYIQINSCGLGMQKPVRFIIKKRLTCATNATDEYKNKTISRMTFSKTVCHNIIRNTISLLDPVVYYYRTSGHRHCPWPVDLCHRKEIYAILLCVHALKLYVTIGVDMVVVIAQKWTVVLFYSGSVPRGTIEQQWFIIQ